MLTERGEQQAKDLRERTATVVPQLMVVSPMRRATQTGLIAFEKIVQQGMPVLALEACHEIGGKHTCDQRLPRSELAKLYPAVNYSLVKDELDPLWGDGSVRESSEHLAQRGADFMAWVRDREESHVVVAAHSSFLFHLMNCVVVANEQDSGWFSTGDPSVVFMTQP